jgi:tetratricopeptide (TPR) repeat protein
MTAPVPSPSPSPFPASGPTVILRSMTGYTTREVAEVLGISPVQVRSFARSGVLEPARGSDGQLRFTFQDIVLLRAARELSEQKLSAQRIRRALRHLRSQLPEGRPLSAVSISAAGEHVVVRDKGTTWEPETGQVAFDFSVGGLASLVEPFAGRVAREAADEELDADGWYDLAWDLEAVSLEKAAAAYRQVLALAPDHFEARVNLGRLLHEASKLTEAEAEYRRAIEAAPANALAHYNLGVALEDQARPKDAAAAYERAVALDATLAEAHFNLARLREQQGDPRGALRHLSEYRRLMGAGG